MFSSVNFRPKTYLSVQALKDLRSNASRRIGTIAGVASVVEVREAILSQDIAKGLEFMSAIPSERSVEEAESGTRGYAQSMLQLKDLLCDVVIPLLLLDGKASAIFEYMTLFADLQLPLSHRNALTSAALGTWRTFILLVLVWFWFLQVN